MVVIPPASFAIMSDRARCGISIEVGAPIASTSDTSARYVKSIMELRDPQGRVVGFIYLAETPQHAAREYTQALRTMSSHDVKALGLYWVNGDLLSSIAPLDVELRTLNISAHHCDTARSQS